MTDIKHSEHHLEFGIFDSVEWGEEPAHDIYERRLKMAEFADENDFFCFHLVEHHTSPLCIAPSPGIFLAALAQRTKRIRLGTLGFLLPFHNPLRLYHEICMIDNMCQGRLELGFARGIVPMEAERFGLPDDEGRKDMMREALDVLVTAFNNDVLDFEGKYYNYSGIRLWQKPYQKPYPPLWYPTANISNVPWAAQAGFNTCGIIETAKEYRELFDLYKKLWAEHKNDPNRLNQHVASPKIGLARNVYVAPNDDVALKDAREAHKSWREHVGFLFDEANIQIEVLDRLSDFDQLIEDEVFIVGSPESVRKQIDHTVEDSGINYFNCLFAFGTLSHQQVMQSMDLFTREVMPAFA